MKIVRIVLAVATFVLAFAPMSYGQQNLNISGVRLWLERPDAMRGPEGYGEDNIYTSYQISSGSFRNFTGNDCWTSADGPNCTQALNGTAAWDATAAPSTAYKGDGTPEPTGPPYFPDVLHRDTVNANWAICGQWLNSVLAYNGTLYGFGHGENPGSQDSPTDCSDYSHHHKTMTLWTSATGSTAGESWANPVKIIDATDDNGSGESGEGDCTAVRDNTYAYLVCRHPTNTAADPTRGNTTGLARAPLGSFSSFIKYDNGWGSQPGVNGSDSDLPGTVAGTSNTSQVLGSSASVWNDKSWMMLLGVSDSSFAGLKVSFTALSNLTGSSIGFTILPEPLFVQETNAAGHYPYGSHPPHNLYIYPSVVSLVDGTRTWDLTVKDQFLLAYTFVPPPNSLTQRILATRSVTVTKSSSAYDPQVLVELATRYDSTYHQYYSSTQPVAYGFDTANSYPSGTFSQITADPVGYLPQLPPANPVSQGQTLTKIVECRNTSPWPSGHPDHLVTTTSCDANYNEETVAGYSYPSKPSSGNSVQIYRCKASNGTHFVAATSTCDGNGTSEKSLGWAVTK